MTGTRLSPLASGNSLLTSRFSQLATRFSLLLFCLLVSGYWNTANAQCLGPPTGTEGEIVYNETSHVPQYCDGNEWIAFAPLPGDGMAAWDKDGPTSGLVGWWKLDETSGPTFADSSGSGNTGSQNRTITGYGAEGMIDNALDLGVPGDTATNGVRIPSDPSISNLTQFTLSTWVYFHARSYHSIISAGHLGPAAAAGYTLLIDNRTGGQISFGLEKSDGTGVNVDTSNYDFLPKRWYHVVATYDGTYGRLYADGDLIREETHINAIDIPFASDTFLGVYSSGGNSYITGKMDDVRIYDRALSATEVKDLYATGGPCSHPVGHEGDIIFNEDLGVMQYCEGDEWVSVGTCAATDGPVLHLKFDETTGDPLDSSGANTTVTATGTVWQPSGGVDGSGAIEFDDDSDYIDIGNAFPNADEITISTWINAQSTAYYQRIYHHSHENVFQIGPNGDIRFDALRWNGDAQWAAPLNTFPYGGWQHLAVTYSYSSVANKPKLYLNGAQIPLGSASPGLPLENGLGASAYIGNVTASGNRAVSGFLDDFRLYDRVLSHEEIENIYKDGLRRMRTNGLVGHWPLDETSGTVANDLSGNGNTGTFENLDPATGTAHGAIDSAISFNGTDQRIHIGDVELSNSAITVSVWYKTPSTTGKTDSIIGKYHASSSKRAYRLSHSNSEVFSFLVSHNGLAKWQGSGNMVQTMSATTTVPNTWYHVVGTFDGAGNGKIFVNGVEDGSATDAAVTSIYDVSTPIYIGYSESAGDQYGEGLIDDVRVYNRALSPEEIALMYEDQVPGYGCTNAGEAFYNTAHDVLQYCNGHRWVAVGKCEVAASGLVGHWKFDTGSGATAVDSSGYGHDLTLEGNTLPAWTTGMIGGATYYAGNEGTNSAVSRVAIGSETHPLHIEGALTIAAWIRPATIGSDATIFRAGSGNDNAYTLLITGPGHNDLKLNHRAHAAGVWTDTRANDVITHNQWQHVAAVREADGVTTTFYVNGEQVGQDVASHPPDPSGASNYLQIGNNFVNGSDFIGEIDDARVYNRALSPGEIKTLYDMGERAVKSDPCAYDTVYPGTECTGGMIYAGTSPHLNAPMYTTPADAPSALPWNNGPGPNRSETFLTSNVMGALNTLTLTEWDADTSTPEVEPHQAAQYCAELTAHGYNDWYLPAIDELQLLYNNRNAIGGFTTSGTEFETKYRSSTEHAVNAAESLNFADGVVDDTNGKGVSFQLRCVRKDLNKTCGQEIAGNPLIMVFDSTNTADGSAANQITIPAGSGAFNYDVTWHDADCNTGTLTGQTGDASFTVPTQGLVTVRITGDFPHFRQASNLDTGLVDVAQWGDIQWGSFQDAFRNHDNLAGFSATDAPDLSNVTSLQSTFRDMNIFNGSIGRWNIANVTSLGYTFSRSGVFNADISGWNTSEIKTMSNSFGYADSFNHDIGGWNTGKLTNMIGTFVDADSFNQDISGWDVSNVTTMRQLFFRSNFNQDISAWNVGKVEDMFRLFGANPNFNQDISGWDVSSVTNMSAAFEGSPSFNQNLSGWDVSSVTNMISMFDGSGLSTANYDAILNGWWALHNSADGPLQSGVTLDAGTIQYSAGAAAAHTGLTTDPPNWTINDGGEQ